MASKEIGIIQIDFEDLKEIFTGHRLAETLLPTSWSQDQNEIF